MVPLGVNNGEKIVIKGRGHQHVKNGNFGDLVILVVLSSQTGFSKGQQELKISIADAVLGVSKKIKTKNGIQKVTIPAGIQDGEVLQVDSLYYSPNRSNEYIKISIRVPESVSGS